MATQMNNADKDNSLELALRSYSSQRGYTVLPGVEGPWKVMSSSSTSLSLYNHNFSSASVL